MSAKNFTISYRTLGSPPTTQATLIAVSPEGAIYSHMTGASDGIDLLINIDEREPSSLVFEGKSAIATWTLPLPRGGQKTLVMRLAKCADAPAEKKPSQPMMRKRARASSTVDDRPKKRARELKSVETPQPLISTIVSARKHSSTAEGQIDYIRKSATAIGAAKTKRHVRVDTMLSEIANDTKKLETLQLELARLAASIIIRDANIKAGEIILSTVHH